MRDDRIKKCGFVCPGRESGDLAVRREKTGQRRFPVWKFGGNRRKKVDNQKIFCYNTLKYRMGMPVSAQNE